MKTLKISWILSIVSMIISLYISATVAEDLMLPTHWNSVGEADAYNLASHAIIFPPAIMIAVLTVLSLLKWFEPRKTNIEQSSRAIAAIALSLTLFMLTFEVSYIAMINGIDVPMMLVISSAVGMLFLIIGNYLSKTRSNFFIGIRTPWTLSSDNVWQKTHRLAGKLFMIAGSLLAIVSWFVEANTATTLMLVSILPAALCPVAYSWWLFQQEQKSNT